MAEFDFPTDPLPIDSVKRPDGTWFFERGKPNKSGTEKSAFQKQHIHPKDDMGGAGRDFVDRISAPTVDARYRFDGGNFSLNGTPLPVSDADAVRLGSSAHRGSHQAYTDIVAKYRQNVELWADKVERAKFLELMGQTNPPTEAKATADARSFADDFMARVWKGVLNTLRMGFQVGGIPELGDARLPALVMHDTDPYLRALGGGATAAAHDSDFYNQNPIERIAGTLNTDPAKGPIGETKGGFEAFQAGVQDQVLPYDRERVLLMEPSDFPDAASRQKFFETRADIIAGDALVRANVTDPLEVARIRQTAGFRQFVTSIFDVLSNSTMLRPGTKTPTDIIEVNKLLENATVGKVGASRAQAEAEARRLYSNMLYGQQAADPAGIERLRATDKTIDDFFKNGRGEVSTRVALTAAMLAAGAIYLRTLYDAQTKDTGQSFADWAAEKAPKFFAALPAATVLIVGLQLIAMTGPIGAAFVLTADIGIGYELLKSFSKNYVTAYPDGKYVGVFTALSDMFTTLEKTTVFKAAHAYYGLLGDIAGYMLSPITPQVEVLTGGTAARLPPEVTWKIWLAGQDQAELFGNDNSNVLFHSGFGAVHGEGGNDILLGLAGKAIKKGDPVWPREPNSPIAEDDLALVLDGGAGNDWVIALGGEKVTTAGGLGRDWIYNGSKGGILYGDVINSTGQTVEDSAANGDNFWYSANTVIKDAQHHDTLKFYGLTLTGGNAEGGISGLASFGGLLGATVGLANFAAAADAGGGKYKPENSIYYDHYYSWMTYAFRRNAEGKLDMFVTNQYDELFTAIFGGTPSEAYKAQQALDAQGILKGWMKVENFDLTGSYIGENQAGLDGMGTFNMVFKAANPLADLMEQLQPLVGVIGMALAAKYGGMAMVDQVLTLAAAALRYAKGNKWADSLDPLVIDLDGDGIETAELGIGQVYFDIDNDLFAERTGWLKGDDGFLVRDLNGNGRIDNISEMFGGAGQSGYAQLASLDSNGDGKITAADVLWSELKVWQDYDRDGVTDAGEMRTLDELGIVSLDLAATAIDVTTPQGARLTGVGDVTFDTGAVRHMYDAILASNDTDTRYAGEAGIANWQSSSTLDVKGFGRVTNLAVAAANDIAFGQLVTSTAAAMTTPKLRTLVAQVGDVLGAWGEALEQTRELTPVLVGTDANGKAVLLDRGVYIEDGQGGYWTLASGAPVLNAQGQPIARATMQDVLAQAAASGATWRLEQTWSPSDRDAALTDRDAAPYLMGVVNGRAVILDYGIKQADGSWKLASDAATSYASKDAILALAHPTGTEWRTEQLGFNPYANLPVDKIGVRFTDGIAVDYTVEVTDQDGTFYVWARNLDRALQLEWKTGDSREFNLRNYAIDFDTLDEVNSTDDSTYRVEMLTPAQFHFATSLGGIDFRPEMLTAQLDNTTGHIAYAVGPNAGANLSTDPTQYVSGIASMINMLQPVMEQYIATSRRYAVRIAMQGGLKDFFRGLTYDLATDSHKPTTNRELAPMFEAIFAGAPASNMDDAVFDYLAQWHGILAQVYPDYHPSGEGNLAGSTLAVDQAFIMQMMLPAFETVGVDLDIRGVAHALGISDERIITHAAGDTIVDGTDSTDYFYMTAGNQTLRGGKGADFYFVGRNSGDDVIDDKDNGDSDELRFTDVLSTDVKAIRDGEDLILQIRGRTNTIRLTDQFLGENNELLSNGKRADSGVSAIVFADGVAWDRFRMSMEVLDRDRAAGLYNDSLMGSGSADILWGGKGNDYMSGGAGGDIYVFQAGDGQDVIDDLGNFSFGPVKAGIDVLSFKGGIKLENLKLIRDGESPDLKIVFLDDDGHPTGDTLVIKGQFAGVKTGLGLFSDALGSSDGLDYVAPNLIERFVFDDGSSMDFTQVVQKVLENAKTANDDAIYGMLNANTLDGGAGNDFLSGKEGDDTSVFGRGYGQDVILDNAIPGLFDPPQHDKLRFVDEIRWTDLDFLRDGASDTLRMRIKGTNDEVVLQDFLATVPILGFVNVIEDIQFGDGTTWTGFKLAQHYIDIAKTGGNDTIYGYDELSDSIDGGAGDDRLVGFGGHDVYYVALGEGNDTILDSSGNDQVILSGIASTDVDFSRTALDLIITVRATGQRFVLENQYVRDEGQTYAVENLVFTDRTVSFLDVNPEDIDLVGTNGDDAITGSNFAETLDGRDGNDTLTGGDGGDTYKFDAGYGQDVIVDRRVRASWSDRRGVHVPVDDVVQFGGGITRDNVVFTKDGNDLLISITGRSDTLRVRNQFRDAEDGVELFRFFDGSTIKISDVEQLLQIAGGNRGDNIITALLDQENVLDGRQGDDTLYGGNRADIYAFSAGYGFDRIIERPDTAGIVDRVVFGASVRFEDIVVSRSGNDLVIDLGSGLDVLTIVNGLSTSRVEQFEFADGRILSVEAIIDRMLTGTAGDDHLIGFDNRDDVLAGGAGQDALEGGYGNDSYKFGIGDGSDSVYDAGGVDKVVFGEGITSDLVHFGNIDGDLLISIGNGIDRLAILSGYSARPVESFVFADGTTLSIEDVRGIIRDGLSNASQDLVDLRELPAASTLRPGAGHDRLILAQDSRVVIGASEGIDSVEMPAGVTSATIVLEAYASSDAAVRLAATVSTDLIVSFSSGSQLIVRGALGNGSLPSIEFANGVIWDGAALVQAAIAGQSSAGSDIIVGSGRADIIAGGAGDDLLSGGAGGDTYNFTRGDGRDVIDDSSGNDSLAISGYRPDELRVSQIDPARNELVLSFADSTDQIVLRYNWAWTGVDAVRFSDGTSFTLDQLRDMAADVGTWQDDRIVGSARSETFSGGTGDDVIIGGGGDDIYRFGRGDGQDRIESSGSADGKGTLVFGAGIALEDIVTTRDADGNIVLSISGTDDRVTLVDPAGDIDPVIATIVFADGRSLSYRALAASIASTDGDDHVIVPSDLANPDIGATIFGGLGNDHVEGGRGADVITGGKGDDLLEGGSGADAYYFGRGDGQDTIADVEITDASKVDKVHFAAGILPSDIRFLSVGPNDLVIGIVGGDDRLTLKDMFRAGTAATDYGVEQFEFADGTVWQLADIVSHAAASTGAGADAIDFGPQLDVAITLDGGAGDDVLAGGIGDTTYVFGRGYGRDTIREVANATGSSDTLRLNSGIAPNDVVVIRDGNDIVLRLVGGDDRLTIVGQAAASAPPIDVVRFNDGTQWSAAALLSRALTPDVAEHVLHPSNPSADPFADPVFAGAGPGSGGGGTSTSSTIGLARFDAVSQPVSGLAVAGSAAALGNGTYQLTPDAGNRVGAVWGSINLSKNVVWTTKMFFGANEGGADGASFAVQNKSGGEITGAGGGGMGTLVSGSFGIIFDTWGQTTDFSQFVVNGQTGDNNFDPRHDFTQLEDAAWHDVVISWDAASKTFSYSVDGTLIGSKTYDVVGSLFGGDSDVWYGFGGATGGASNDQRVQILSVTSLEGAGVDPSTVGTVEQIGSGLFARELAGTAERNTYNVFVPLARWGERVDVVTNFKSGDVGDTLNIAIADGLSGTLLARASGSDTVIYFAEQGVQSFAEARQLLRLNNVSPASLTGVNFAGAPFTVVANQTLNANGAGLVQGGWGDDTIRGDAAANTLSGGAGNDTVTDAGDGNDTLTGGTGNDWLRGGGGNDTYAFNRGDGQDTISDGNYGTDTIQFGTGIAATDLVVTQASNGQDLVISIAGSDDRITIQRGVIDAAYRIEQVRFADGSSLSYAQLLGQAVAPTAGDDRFYGDEFANTLSGGAGNDTLDAGSGNDTLSGGTGNDWLRGAGGDDTYVFNRGDGQDIISDWTYGADTIQFGAGIAAADLVVTQASNDQDLVISIAGSDDRITIQRGIIDPAYRIEQVRFADGSSLSYAQLFGQAVAPTAGDDRFYGDEFANTLSGGAGNDTVTDAGGGNDILTGGTGNDWLRGGGGDDTYVFNRGDGQDIISDWNSGNDTIQFGTGIAAADLVVSQANGGQDLVISIAGSDDRITIQRGIIDSAYRIEQVRFADGSSLSYAQLFGQAVAPTAGDDRFYGDEFANTLSGGAGNDTVTDAGYGNDILTGGTGNDWLRGAGGDDTYVFNRGDGQDIISDWLSGTDTIQFGAGIAATDLVVTQASNDQDLVISIAGSDDKITIQRGIIDASYRIEQVRFADGSSLSYAQLFGQAVAPTAGDDRFYGDEFANTLSGGAGNDTVTDAGYGNDILTGGTGNDWLRGGVGDDTYVFNRGDGQDIISDWLSGNDTIQFGAGIAATDLVVARSNDGADLIIAIAGTDDRITIQRGIIDSSYRIEQLRFADNSTLGYAQLLERALAPISGDDTLNGDGLANTLSGDAGNDTLDAGSGNDTLTGETGNDWLRGGGGDDTYVFNRGDGQDIISDWLSGNDTIQFGAGIAAADLVVTQANSGQDLVISIAGTDDRITIQRGIIDASYRIEQVRFADGSSSSYAQLFGQAVTSTARDDRLYGDELANTLSGGAGNDTLDAGSGNDTLSGETGNDWLRGGGGDDTYVFNRGGGQDVISDWLSGNDAIQFGAGIAAADLVVSQANNGQDLVISIAGTDDRITVERGIIDASYRIEQARFADGSSLSYAQLFGQAVAPTAGDDRFYGDELADTLSGGAGNDTLDAGYGNDTLTGGTGNDWLRGAGGDDTYVFNRGDGQDVISDWLSGNDAIQFGAGIAAADLVVSQGNSGQDLFISIAGADDRITVERGIVDASYRIEQVRFADGSSLSYAQLFGQAVAPTAGDDRFFGDEFANTLSGGAGNDTLDAGYGNDTLSGGTGNDWLRGGVGDDTYVFNRGDGQDIISDWNSGNDTIQFGAGIAAADLVVSQGNSGQDLVISIAGTDDRITVERGIIDPSYRIEQVRFADGSSLSYAQLFSRSTTTSGADVIIGTTESDTLEGRAGDDILSGLAGADILLGGDGNDTLGGGDGADRLVGGRGDDTLVGGKDADTYVFAAGDGSDTIIDDGNATSDTLRIEGYGLSQMRFRSLGNDLVIRFLGSSGRIIVRDGLSDSAANTVEAFEIAADGLTLSLADIRPGLVEDVPVTGEVLIGSASDDTIVGSSDDDYLKGGDGADTLSGGAGNDQFGDISADSSVDTLTGGAGRDAYYYLPVRQGADPIVADVITDFQAGAGGDVIRLMTSNPNPFEGGSIFLAQSGSDTVVMMRATSGPDQVLLRLLGVDATTLTSANFDGVPIAIDNSISINDDDAGHVLNGSVLDDRIYGNGGNDVISGFGGDDRLAGGADNDVIDGGLGNDLIAGQEGKDQIIGGGGSDIMSGGSGDDVITGYGDGSFATDTDVFEGGEGDDRLSGGTGTDIYRFARGDGRDTISDLGGSDRLEFATGIAAADVSVVQAGRDVELRINNEGGRIRVTGALDGASAIETIAFADGTTWTWNDVLTRSLQGSSGDDVIAAPSSFQSDFVTLDGKAGNDTLQGSAGADTLIGGTGNDVLQGAGGDDTYVFARGDGQDLILDTSGTNTLSFAAGILSTDIRVVRGAPNLVLEIIGTGDRVDLGSPAIAGMGVSRVTFADGTVWTASTLIALARTATDGDDVIRGDDLDNMLAGNAGDDLLIGNGGADDLDGGIGKDRLEGGAGDDTYRFAAHGGHDRIADAAGNDTLLLAADIVPDDITVSQSEDGSDFTLIVKSTGARVTIEGALGAGGIESIRFADGTVWGTSDLIARAPSFADDVLSGDAGNNVMIGGLGNDHLSGGAGNDTYRFARGDGNDVINDQASSAADRLEISGYTAAEVSFHRIAADSDDVAIRFAGTTDQIVIVDALGANSAGVETIALADGTQYTVADIKLAILASLTTDGNDIIIGTDGADTLMGGKGNDLIDGGYGNDSYLYRRGDGDDRIDAVGKGTDVLSLTDYNVADVVSAARAGPDSNDLVLSFSGAGDRVVLIDALSPSNNPAFGLSVRFADGTVWNRDAMRARVLSDIDGTGNDNVYGFDGSDTFAARAGNDLLSGAAGDDLYLFGRGAGNDTVVDSGTNGTDRIQIADFASTEASVEQLYRGSDAVVIRFTGNSVDSLTVFDALSTDAKGIESYVFADGVTWTKETLRQLLGNRAPTALGDGFFSVTTGVELVIKAADLLRNDFDADGDALTIIGVDAGDSGVATIDSEGNIRYTATSGYYGSASINYTISDGHNGFATASIDLKVRPVATAYPDSGFTVAEDGSLVIRVERLLANDLDGDRMIVGQVYQAVNGTVALASDGNITFTPTADFNGTAEFSYVANTPEGGRAEAKVTIQVTAVNDAPVAHGDTVDATLESTGFTLDPSTLSANDTDIDRDGLTVQSVISNADVTVTIGDDGLIHVTPRAYFWGNAYFDYVVADPSGATSTGRVNFTVTPVNDPPEAHDDRFETTDNGDPIREDNPIVIGADRLLANDIEHDGETMTLTAVRNSHGGNAVLLENNTVLFTPTPNFNGDAWFEYQVDDGHGGTAWARATLAYQPVNDLPDARNDSYTDQTLPILRGTEDHAIEIPIIELLKNDTDTEGFAVQFESAGNAVHGDIEVTDHGTIIFTPDADFWGEATFSYLISDNEGAVDGATVTMWFENVGDAPPVARRDVIYVNEDIPTVIPIATLLANDADVDRDPLRFLGWRLSTTADVLVFGGDAGQKLNGTIEYDADGNLVFTPNRDASQGSGFVYGITDDADGSAEGYIDIVIVPTNDDPTVGQDEGFVTPLDAPLVLRVTDLLKNDYDIEQADHDGDGVIDDDLDNPNRARPTFVEVDGVYDADALALGQRVPRGTAEVVEWNGEKFIVVHFPTGFTGQVAVEYRIADADGATDTGFAMASVADSYNGLLRGTAKADYLVGTDGADLIQALGGNDFVLAGGGNDRIEAGSGDDQIDAGAGDDWIDAGDGADRITGGDGYDTISFENSDFLVRADLESRVGQGGYAQGDTYIGIEALVGSQYADQLGGDAGDNRLEGLGGNDLLEGRGGNDILLGGEGDDVLTGGAGADVLDGGLGNNTADYSFGATGVSIQLAAGTAHGGDAEGDVLTNIQNLTGTDVDDTLEGDALANILSAVAATTF